MLPVLFKVGNFPVHAWGLLLMAGFLLATWRAAKNGKRYEISPEDVWDIALIGLFGGIVGARLLYVALTWNDYATNPLNVFALWNGGMTSFGGFVGGILAGVLACRFKKVNAWDMADLAAVSFPIGYFFGRIGCFLNGCCYGGVCDLPWAVRFHIKDASGMDILTAPSHPAQLYAAIASVVMFAILLPLERRRAFRGQVILAFLILYSIYRFLVEFVREGTTADSSGILNLTEAQVACIVIAIISGIVYGALVRKSPLAEPVSEAKAQ